MGGACVPAWDAGEAVPMPEAVPEAVPEAESASEAKRPRDHDHDLDQGESGDEDRRPAKAKRAKADNPQRHRHGTTTAKVGDLHRTGAKCVPTDSKQDEHLPGRGYHVLGAVRTKPGRGDPTLSVSCSDKIMRWNCVGLQGALLSLLLDRPVFLRSITIGGGCPYSDVAMKRAIVDRVSAGTPLLPAKYVSSAPVFLQASIPFPDGRYALNAPQPCPSSLIWCHVPNRNLEVAVEGKKQGATKKSQNSRAGRLLVSKVELLRQFELVSECTGMDLASDCASDSVPVQVQVGPVGNRRPGGIPIRSDSGSDSKDDVLHAMSGNGEDPSADAHTDNGDHKSRAKYSELKGRASVYSCTWRAVRSAAKLGWTDKCPTLLDFYVDYPHDSSKRTERQHAVPTGARKRRACESEIK